MKNRSGEEIKLTSIDELLGVVNEESAMEIEISKIHPFKNQKDAGSGRKCKNQWCADTGTASHGCK